MTTSYDDQSTGSHSGVSTPVATNNNNTIDRPAYYRLPDGTYLEDALFDVDPGMAGPIWDACVYRFRAGRKDGEPFEKDMAKFNHYVSFYARRSGNARQDVERMVSEALDAVYAAHGNPVPCRTT